MRPNPVSSPDGTLIATLQHSSLKISTFRGVSIRTISLPADFLSRCRLIRWSRLRSNVVGSHDQQSNWQCNRILLANDDTVRVYDLDEAHWSATIERASANLGSIADAAFGHTSDKVLVFSNFGVKLTIWSLVNSRGVEIRDPKYRTQCYSYRPRSGHIAVLTRPAAQDVLLLLQPDDHVLVNSVDLPTTDAQEIGWSSDGQWLAIRDAASSGPRLCIYTADGHLFKTYTGVAVNIDVDLGFKSVAWSNSNSLLAIGDYNHTLTILAKNTVNDLVVAGDSLLKLSSSLLS